jgi:hypothetical protein
MCEGPSRPSSILPSPKIQVEGFPTPKKGFWNPDLRDPEQLGPAINLAVTTALCALPTVPLPCIAILTSHRHGETAPAPRGASGGLAGWVKSELWEKHPVGEKLGQGPPGQENDQRQCLEV